MIKNITLPDMTPVFEQGAAELTIKLPPDADIIDVLVAGHQRRPAIVNPREPNAMVTELLMDLIVQHDPLTEDILEERRLIIGVVRPGVALKFEHDLEVRLVGTAVSPVGLFVVYEVVKPTKLNKVQ